MKNINKTFSLLTLVSLLCFYNVGHAQIDPSLKEGLKYKLNEDGSHWIKMNMTTQLWLRYNDNNPASAIGASAATAYAVPTTYDASIRRMRFVLSGQVTDRLSFFVQWGQNGISPIAPRKSLQFFHDITAEYAVIPKHFVLGTGIMGWDGPGRYSNPSTTSIMGIDLPVYQQTENDITEQDVRKLGVYAKGKIEKLDYRVSVGIPYAFGISQIGGAVTNPGDAFVLTQSDNSKSTNPYTKASPSAYNISTYNTVPMGATSGNVKGTGSCYQGYFAYQFLDQESNFGAGTNGTYLGKKKVFNIGAGFKYTPNAMMHLTGADSTATHKYFVDTVTSDMKIFCVDVFLDYPINKDKGTAITAYAAYTNSDYGAKYIRNVGANNTTNQTLGGSSFNGTGNGFPALGTGSSYYTQVGYKFKDGLLGSQGTLQPYANFLYASYDRLSNPVMVWGAGLSWLINGHNQKVTLGIENRPVFVSVSSSNAAQYSSNSIGDIVDSKSNKMMAVLQYQIAF